MLYLGLFGTGMLKNYFHICNQHPTFYLIAKSCAKIRIPKFTAKNAYLGDFGCNFEKPLSYLKIYNKNPLTCSSNFNIFLSYLKSAPLNVSNRKAS